MKFRNFEQGADSLHDDASVKEMDVAHPGRLLRLIFPTESGICVPRLLWKLARRRLSRRRSPLNVLTRCNSFEVLVFFYGDK